jgi:hypothetical protein
VALLVGIGIIIGLVNSVASNAALAYNEQLVAASQRLDRAGKQFGLAVNESLRFENANVEKLRAEHQRMLNEVKSIQNDSRSWKPPSSKSGQDLAKGFDQFLVTQEQSVAKLGEIIPIVAERGLTQQDRAQRVLEVIRVIQAREGNALNNLRQLQQAMAKEHNFQIR